MLLPDLPVSLRLLSPLEAAARCVGLPGVVFFDSAYVEDGQGEAGAQRWSLLAACPSEVIRGDDAEAWQRLETVLEARRGAALAQTGGEAIPATGFAAGWVEYEGALCFGIYEGALAYRHDTDDKGEGGEWRVIGDFKAVMPLFEALDKPSEESVDAATMPKVVFAPTSMNRAAYMAAVEQAQEAIAAGDIYQVNLTHQFTAEWRGEWAPFVFYRRLRTVSPAPYAAYLSLEGRQVVSSSPELFLKIDGRRIATRPIKGTRPRGATAREDAAQEGELVTSRKETAELVMITDLERNDLGQVCEYGSVQVSELLKLERYRHVFHLVSTVEGQLRQEVSAVEAFRACFPGGSITGAPKKRAREIIEALEPVARGLYTGAIGYFGFDGQAQFNIAIRTVVVEGECAHFHVGAGIVADSLPAAEWAETLHKARGILLAAEMG